MDFVIRNATIATLDGVRDIGIDSGRIVQISDHIEIRGVDEIHAQGFLVSPGFIDVHMHLDKALIIWGKWEAEEAKRIAPPDQPVPARKPISVEDVRDRAIRTAQMCVLNGTTTLRTHVDITVPGGLTAMHGVLAAKEACRDWISMQINPFPIRGFDGVEDETEKLMRSAIELGADLIGGVPDADSNGVEHVDRIFSLAKEYDLDIDFHTDMIPAPEPFLLPYIAEKTLKQGWEGRVLAGHCFALGHVTPEVRQAAIQKCAEAKVSICATPFATIQERLIDPINGGVNATYMSDNIRDTWSPYGNADMLQLALFAGRLGSWRTSREIDELFDIGTLGAARAIGLGDKAGVEVGNPADLVILQARSRHEAIVTQAEKLWVFKNGNPVVCSGELLTEPL